MLVSVSQKAVHVGKKRAVGTEVVLKRLVVTYAYGNTVENRQLRGLGSRNQHSPLEHILEQTHGLEAYRFASGVGSGDDENAFPGSQGDGQRTYFLVLFPERFLEQGVACLAQVVFPVFGDYRHSRNEIQGCLCLCYQEVHLTYGLRQGNQLRDVGSEVFGESIKYPRYFPVLLEAQFVDFVFELHNFGGLYESCLSGSGAVHHKTGQASLFGGVDRNQEFAAADADLCIVVRDAFGPCSGQNGVCLP